VTIIQIIEQAEVEDTQNVRNSHCLTICSM